MQKGPSKPKEGKAAKPHTISPPIEKEFEGRLCTEEEMRQCSGVLIRIVDGEITSDEGLEIIGKILNPEVPF